LHTMTKVALSTPEKIASLCNDLNEFHRCQEFDGFQSMGEVLSLHLQKMVERTEGRKYLGRTSFKA